MGFTSYRLSICIGALLALMGGIVMGGWFFDLPSLVQILPGWGTMVFNTALGFFLSGLVFLSMGFPRPFSALGRLAAGLVFLLGFATLAEYLGGWNFGIDALFMRSSIVPHPFSPGRMAPNTALCFLLTGICLLCRYHAPASRYNLSKDRCTNILATMVTTLGGASAFGYLLDFTPTYRWGTLPEMSIHTSLNFLLVGGSLLALTWKKRRERGESPTEGFHLVSSVAIITLSLCLWQALTFLQKQHVYSTLETKAEKFSKVFSTQLESQMKALTRMARRWEVGGQPQFEVWRADAQNYVDDFPEYSAIEWVDASYRVRWVVPIEGNERDLNQGLSFHSNVISFLKKVKREKAVDISNVLSLPEGTRGFLSAVPIYGKGGFDGFILAVFKLPRFFDVFLEDISVRDPFFTIWEQGREIYRSPLLNPQIADGDSRDAFIQTHNLNWTIRTWLSPEEVRESRTYLPEGVLLFGLLAALFIARLILFYQKEQHHIAAMEATQTDLEEHIFRRQRVEQALRSSESWLREILNLVPHFIFAKNRRGRFILANRAVAEAYGTTVDSLVGSPEKEFCLSPEELEHFQKDDQEVIRSGKPLFIAQESMVDAQRKTRILQTTKIPFTMVGSEEPVVLGVAIDITDRFYAEQALQKAHVELATSLRELQKEKDRIQKLFDIADVIIVQIDTEQNVVSINQKGCDVLGYLREEIIGKNWFDHFVPESAREATRGGFHLLLAGKNSQMDYFTNPVSTRNGGEPLIEWRNSILYDENGHILGTLSAGQDITERMAGETALKKAHTELEQRVVERTGDLLIANEHLKREITERQQTQEQLLRAKDEAENASKEKSEFLSRMSHELRTPLNAILGFAQIMEANNKESLSPEQINCLKQILKGGHHLLSLINEVLNLSTVESGNLEITLESIRVCSIVDETLTLILPLAEQYRVSIHNNIPKDWPVCVQADRMRLKQVLLNLLANGIKYNRPGGDVYLDAKWPRSNRVHLIVSDTGVGIPAEKYAVIFEPFQRLDTGGIRVEGNGIGLSICKRLLERMGGSIGLDSEPGRGSRFALQLPLGDSEAAQRVSPGAPLPLPAFSQDLQTSHTLLYVDDDEANMTLVQHILRRYPSVRLVSAMNATEGLQLAREIRPDLILMDIHMPGMDGFAALHLLQSVEETANIPVIAFSADAMKNEIDRALEAGFRAYITKPIQIDRFIKTLQEFLKKGLEPPVRSRSGGG